MKQTFAAKTFAAKTFASGAWAGIGVAHFYDVASASLQLTDASIVCQQVTVVAISVGTAAYVINKLLMEDGDVLLLESGDEILLESSMVSQALDASITITG